MAANAITKGGGAWKLSIIGAPVTDYHLYDSIFTERYMGLPKDNPQGYASTRVMDAVPSMRGKCLMFHGLMDDNVHLQNSVMLLDALQANGKDYDLVFFPGAGHGPRGAWQNWNRYKAMWTFIQQNL
jgi:dipeptidyl-peptidase 4